jgi:hypothetical protein
MAAVFLPGLISMHGCKRTMVGLFTWILWKEHWKRTGELVKRKEIAAGV